MRNFRAYLLPLFLCTLASPLICGCRGPAPSTPIHAAAFSGDVEQLQRHVRCKTPINIEKDGLTPLDSAIQGKQMKAIKYLLKQGAVAFRPKTIEEAIKTEEKNIINIIAKAGGDISHGLLIAVRNQDKRLAEIFIKKNADTRLALVECVHTRDLKMLRWMVSQGGDPNAKTQHGESILHVAAFDGDSQLVEYLLEKGASASAQNSFGETPLKIAMDRKHTEIVKMLRKHGAE